MITVKAPGKLYIAGEYAVVESGFPAIIVALDQFVTATISPSDTFGSIVSKQYQENSIFWRRQGDAMVFDNRDNPFHYILAAISLTETYAREAGRELGVYHLSINSELDSADGKKYGLGSSAAVTVATVKALCQFYHLPMTKSQLFKLAAIAHLSVQGNGSLGDIAASVYGGWLAYHSFDRQWLAEQRQTQTLTALLAMPWPDLKVDLLTPPAELRLMIGWTGSPASTSHLVDKVSLVKAKQRGEYQTFLQDSKACLKRMVHGFHTGDLAAIQTELRQNRHLLQVLGDFSHVTIETPILKKMIAIAETAGAAAKTSGAGGGDCGIVLIDQAIDTTQMLHQWAQEGIERLNLNVHTVLDEPVSHV
ncbi:phosphomevalonate kinase [Lactiplantibacillus mudanjiangensis]|uniref:phosphomevalonate kinase n=1 Tax=Lactiplantibacillus mudanjiangensis TaxID=1296538 RepID=A0A660E5B7_9LACO|nr:phosphomevalonate kinase [Lactiplantibacillus mudanjiangensis]VDG24422.1 phosphomevalonate kinase [Lactobacillus sp.] [Lactiplantibacillus mudanjiangensis]VDG28224.1 phosphomevalonate kinase [Lactobacillus sp.] [Lactiplantibacillus mudanjiangensis]VDG31178.1 phosphomevalonate kinase [Lactobacillus sp.] [Lactiplantibacillus mudanjiangensis]